jgi:hypothetical protein
MLLFFAACSIIYRYTTVLTVQYLLTPSILVTAHSLMLALAHPDPFSGSTQ